MCDSKKINQLEEAFMKCTRDFFIDEHADPTIALRAALQFVARGIAFQDNVNEILGISVKTLCIDVYTFQQMNEEDKAQE